MREIGDAAGLSSTSSVNYQVRRLQPQRLATRTAQEWQPYG